MSGSDNQGGAGALLPFVHQVLLPALPKPGTLTNASTDDQIIALWLARPNTSPRTHRNNGKDALRFQLWCRAYGLGLKDVRYEHLVAYTAFLAKLPAEWINPVKLPRIEPAWRPFARQLSERSQRQAMIVIKAMLTWMHKAEYLPKNPAVLLGKLSMPIGETVTRYLPAAGINYLFRAADALPAERPTQAMRRARARFLVRAYYTTATRLSELVGASMHSLRPDEHGEWWLHVIGKGSKAGQVPVSAALVEEYCRYRRAFGLPSYPDEGEDLPLLLSSRGPVRRLSDYAAARAMKQLLQLAAKLAKSDGQHHLVRHLNLASTHWLRHSILTHQANAGMPLKTVQLNARHADISTTGHYLHKEGRERHAETLAALKALQER